MHSWNEWMNELSWAQLVLGRVTFCDSVCNQPTRSTQPSTLCETVKWVSALKLSNNNKWRRWVCRWWQPTGRLTAQVSYLGLRVGGCLAVWIHWMNQVNSHGLAMMHYKYWHYYYYFGPRYILSRGSLKIDKKIQNWVQSPVCAVCNWQTVMQKDSIEALHQNRDPLVQKAGFSSLTRVFRDLPSKIIVDWLSSV